MADVNARISKPWWVLAGVAAISLATALSGLPLLAAFGRLACAALLLGLLLVLLVRALRAFLWSVGRRLAFSYFLIGVLPVPMLAVILSVGLYLMSGLFLAHLFRSALFEMYRETAAVAQSSGRSEATSSRVQVAWYEDGVRQGGTALAPEQFPAWLAEETRYVLAPENLAPQPPLVELPNGALSIAAAVEGADGRGTVAVFTEDLAPALSARTSAWVELIRSDDPELEAGATLEIFDETYFLVPPRLQTSDARQAFLEEAGLASDALRILGFERIGTVVSLEDGSNATNFVSANLYGQPRSVYRALLSSASKIDTFAWLAFLIPAFLLFDLYVIAVLMAIFLILSLSRAVNRLTSATEKVKAGDFAARIPVRRTDQIGALQQSFNEMGANLESLVDQAAQKEILDKELQIARELQMSLIPRSNIETEGAEFATSFEPSLAIGGDYFDIVRLQEAQGRLAVVVADVAGHGISAGLRMAMLKAAVGVLVRERKRPEDILESLDDIVRAEPSRAFVTATLGLLDLSTGEVSLTNAGHTPVYHLSSTRGAHEIMLPSTPLGALGRDYAAETLQLQGGDFLVWLSDGLVEATDEDDTSFGFERTRSTLEAAARGQATAATVRDALIEAVQAHTRGRPGDDDRTLVVMRYRPGTEGPADAAEGRADSSSPR